MRAECSTVYCPKQKKANRIAHAEEEARMAFNEYREAARSGTVKGFEQARRLWWTKQEAVSAAQNS